MRATIQAAEAEALQFIARKDHDLMAVLHAACDARGEAQLAEMRGDATTSLHLRVFADELMQYAIGVTRYLTPEAVAAATIAAKAAGRTE